MTSNDQAHDRVSMRALRVGEQFIGPDGTEYVVTVDAASHERGWVFVRDVSTPEADAHTLPDGTDSRDGFFNFYNDVKVERVAATVDAADLEDLAEQARERLFLDNIAEPSATEAGERSGPAVPMGDNLRVGDRFTGPDGRRYQVTGTDQTNYTGHLYVRDLDLTDEQAAQRQAAGGYGPDDDPRYGSYTYDRQEPFHAVTDYEPAADADQRGPRGGLDDVEFDDEDPRAYGPTRDEENAWTESQEWAAAGAPDDWTPVTDTEPTAQQEFEADARQADEDRYSEERLFEERMTAAQDAADAAELAGWEPPNSDPVPVGEDLRAGDRFVGPEGARYEVQDIQRWDEAGTVWARNLDGPAVDPEAATVGFDYGQDTPAATGTGHTPADPISRAEEAVSELHEVAQAAEQERAEVSAADAYRDQQAVWHQADEATRESEAPSVAASEPAADVPGVEL